MRKLDQAYIGIGFIWLIVGMILGIWLGATEHLTYSNSHAHLNLLGFVISTLFGIVYKLYPSMATSRLAFAQFAIYELGIAILVLGKFLFDGGTRTPLLEIGSLTTILGVVLMAVVFLKSADVRALKASRA